MCRSFFAWLATAGMLCFGTSFAYGPSATDAFAPRAWTEFRLNAANNAVVPGTLATSWDVQTNGAFSSSPTLVGRTLYIGNNAGVLYAIDVSSGHVLWTYRASNPIMSAPIVDGNLVVVGEGNENSPVGSSPSHPIRVGSGTGALIGIDRTTGRERWQLPLSGSGMPTAAVVKGIVVHHDGAGNVVAVSPSGRLRYRRNLHSIASMVSALPIDGTDFITAGEGANALWRLHAGDGATVWKSAFPNDASGVGDCPPASDGERIYCDYIMPAANGSPVAVGAPATERAYAIDARTGKRIWDGTIESGILPQRNEAAIPLIAGGTLFIGSSLSPWMHALEPGTGRLLWRTKLHGPVKGGIVDVAGTIYFGDLGGYLWALDAGTGRALGVKRMGTSFNVGSPIVVGQTLVIGSLGGKVLAVPLQEIRDGRDT